MFNKISARHDIVSVRCKGAGDRSLPMLTLARSQLGPTPEAALEGPPERLGRAASRASRRSLSEGRIPLDVLSGLSRPDLGVAAFAAARPATTLSRARSTAGRR